MIKQGFVVLISLAMLIACDQGAQQPPSAPTVRYVHVGPNWDALNKLASESGDFNVRVRVQRQAALGDQLQVQATSERDGHLWVVFVDPDDQVTLMYPNSKSTDNAVRAGETVTIPNDNSGWSLQATEPVGETLIAFIVTVGDLDLNDILTGSGESTMTEALMTIEDTASWSISKRVLEVVE